MASTSPPESRPFEGRVAIVTGASRGIGWATARLLAFRGAHVVLDGLEGEPVVEQAATLGREHGVTCLGVIADVGDEKAVAGLYRTVQSTFKRLDFLVNNAGVLGDAMVGMIPEQMIARVLQVNLAGVIRNLQLASRLMRRGTGGAIVNVASIIGLRGNPGQVVYGSSKAGVVGLTLSAAKELGPHHIRVNAVAPGYIDTDMIRHLDPAVHAGRIAGIPLGRVGAPEDVAKGIAFLLSDEAAYITGQVLGVDGGMVI
jgi:3-oxoacyl-[acyl-carrier protein] reductase